MTHRHCDPARRRSLRDLGDVGDLAAVLDAPTLRLLRREARAYGCSPVECFVRALEIGLMIQSGRVTEEELSAWGSGTASVFSTDL